MADERVNLKVDIDVTGENQLGAAAAKLTAFSALTKTLETRTNRLSGAMGSFNIHMTQSKRGALQFTKQLTLLERISAQFIKRARMMLFSVIALGIEFGVSALSLASVNAAFAVGKFAMQAYNYGMQALAGTVAALGVAAIAAAAAFKEFQAAQFQYRYKDSKEVGSALDQSAAGLRSLYKDASLATFGVQALAGAFAAVNKNAAFTPASKAALKALSDFVQASGDPANSLQSAGTMIGILQKEKKFTAEAVNAAKSISPEFDKAFKKGNYKSVQTFLDDLKSGKLAADAGVTGQSDAVGRTLFAQFKSYLSFALVELSDIGVRVLEPVKEAMHDIFKGLTRSFRRVSGDLVTFGRGPFLKAMVAFTQKLEDFTIVLFRKFLPATEGFWKRTSNAFKQFAVYFREVKDALQPLREGGSIVIDTFGKPIIEVFKQIGKGVTGLADQAVKNKDNFLQFGDALKSVVQGFFEISRAIREAFGKALPMINRIVKAFAGLLEIVAGAIGLVAKGGQVASTAMLGGLGYLAFQGRRSARYKRNRMGSGSTKNISMENAIYSGMPFNRMGGGFGAEDGLGPLSGNMASAISGAMNPAANNLSNAAGQLSQAAHALGSAAAVTGARGGTLRGGLGGGRVDTDGNIRALPNRKPGQNNFDYAMDVRAYKNANPGTLPPLYARGTPALTGSVGLMSLRTLNKQQAQELDRMKRRQLRPNAPTGPHSNIINAPGMRYDNGARYRTDAALMQSGFLPLGLSGNISGAMGGSGGPISGALGPMNAKGGGVKNLGSRLSSFAFGRAGKDLGNRGVAKNLKGFLGLKTEAGSGDNPMTRFTTSEKGGNFGQGYRIAYNNFLEAQKKDPTLKFSQAKALKSAARYSMSGMGMVAGLAGQALASSKYVPDEAKSAVSTGSGLMMFNPALGIGVGGAMMAKNAKTKMGGALSGAASGAAIGGMIFGPGGALVGAAAGAALGTMFASRNQTKMVQTAMKHIGEAQLSAVAKGAVEGGLKGSTTKARALLAATGNLSKDFAAINRKQDLAESPGTRAQRDAAKKTGDAERLKLLQPYINAGLIDGNTLSLATGGKRKEAEKALTDVHKTMKQALTPAFNSFDEIMKSLKQSTGMTTEAIYTLAMERNVDLYSTTLKASDAIKKMGVGMAKTALQFRQALIDIQVSSLDVFSQFKQSKEMKDALQSSGDNIRGGDTSTEAFLDYYTKLQDFQNITNPNTPLSNFIVQSQRFGAGANVGKGSMFGPGGTMSGITMGKEAAELINQSQGQTASGSAFEATKQIGALMTGANFRFKDVDKGFGDTQKRIKDLIVKAQGGDKGAMSTITALETAIAQGTLFKGKSASGVSDALSVILGIPNNTKGTGGKGRGGGGIFGGIIPEMSAQLDPFKDILTAEAELMREQFFQALKTGFFENAETPLWWNQAPSWWDKGYNAELDGEGKLLRLIAAGDTATAKAGQIGDTSTAKNLKRTMGRHSSFDGMLPGKRTVTSSLRDFNLGSPSSDHATGNAYDLVGQNLGSYSSLIKAAGGFSEFHGTAGSRHLHVVPPPGPMGDTSVSMLSKMSGGDGGSSVGGDTFNITVNETGNAQATAKAVAQEIVKMQRNWNQRV